MKVLTEVVQRAACVGRRTTPAARTAVALASVALAVTVLSSRGLYVADYRFALAWAPGRTLARLQQIWDSTGSLGQIAGADRNPIATVFFGAVRGFGAEPWLAQRLWHAALLTLAGTGAAQLTRFFAPGRELAAAIAGLAYMMGPLAVGLLRPSSIFAGLAVAGWLLAALCHGVTGDDGWRWAAVAALAMLLVAPTELPGAVYLVAFLPVVAVLLVHLERVTTWSRVVGWFGRVAVLTIPLCGFVVVRSVLGRGALESRLLTTESPEATSVASSSTEVFRGLGNWLTYFRFGTVETRVNLADYLENPFVIAATMLVPIVGFAVALGRWRAARSLVVLAAIGLTVGIGAHPYGDPSPWGSIVKATYEAIPASQAFRNTLKAAPVYALAVAVMFGVAVDFGVRHAPRRSLAVAALVAALVAVMGAAGPALVGDLYDERNAIDAVPDYWIDAVDWLDGSDRSGLALVLPGSSSTAYRWGSPGDDIFEALLHRRHLRGSPFAAGSSGSSDITAAIDTRLTSTQLRTGSVAAVARRLGVRYIVIRNDLAWQESGLPRPAALDPIRADPGSRLVAEFGEPGTNTVPQQAEAAVAEDALSAYEATLAPVQIYEIVDAWPAPTDPGFGAADLVVVGDGDAVFALGQAGIIDAPAPIRFAAAMDDETLTASLRRGSPIVVTDTNVRRAKTATATSTRRSAALPAEDERALPPSRFPEPADQTISWMPDAAAVIESMVTIGQPWVRGEQAFDGDPDTAWRVPPLRDPKGQSLTLLFREPTPIGAVSLLVADFEARRLVAGHLATDDGRRWPFTVNDGRAELDLGESVTSSLAIVIDEVEGGVLEQVGFAEITVDGLDLRPARRLPATLEQRVADNDDLAEALAAAEVWFTFERELPADQAIVERSLRRLFWSDRPRSFTLTGRVPRPLEPTDQACLPAVRVGDATIDVRLVDDGDAASVRIVGCAVVEVSSGWTLLDDVSPLGIDSIVLAPVDPRPLPEPDDGPATVEILSWRHDRLEFQVDAPSNGARLRTGIAFDDQWTATVDGREVPIEELDGQVGVGVSAGTSAVALHYDPQRTYGVAVTASAIGALMCIWLVVRPRCRQQGEEPS